MEWINRSHWPQSAITYNLLSSFTIEQVRRIIRWNKTVELKLTIYESCRWEDPNRGKNNGKIEECTMDCLYKQLDFNTSYCSWVVLYIHIGISPFIYSYRTSIVSYRIVSYHPTNRFTHANILSKATNTHIGRNLFLVHFLTHNHNNRVRSVGSFERFLKVIVFISTNFLVS